MFSCDRSGDFPNEPIIAFKSAEIYDGFDTVFAQPTKMVALAVDFTDGDGDIGVEADSATSPNFIIAYYEMRNGNWVQPLPENSFSATIPPLTPTGQNKSLKGEIKLDLNISNRGSDSLMFDMELMDRSGNISNRVSTPLLVVE